MRQTATREAVSLDNRLSPPRHHSCDPLKAIQTENATTPEPPVPNSGRDGREKFSIYGIRWIAVPPNRNRAVRIAACRSGTAVCERKTSAACGGGSIFEWNTQSVRRRNSVAAG